MKTFIKTISVVLAIVMSISLFGCSKQKDEPATTATTTTTTTVKAKTPLANPFTGSTKYNKNAKGIRPVAIVVENLQPARPQWGIETPDIIVEGEVEGGISRMLWLYADYKSVPSKVGPIRSARPPFIQFSELFDAIYIHWGGSHSKAGYVGGYEVLKKDDVAHFDGMRGGILYGRDQTRNVSSEHRGIIYGDKLPEAIKQKNFRTKINKKRYPEFEFNSKKKDAGSENASKVGVTFSSISSTRDFTYNTNDKMYHTGDWRDDVKFQNIIALSTTSKYYTTPYQGGSTTYLNYDILNQEGNGYYASNGKITQIKWSTKSGTLELKTIDGKKLALNQGRSYIGLCSSNHSGNVSYQ